MLKKLLLFVILSLSCFAKAQTLYWVGGSGNLNDKYHWSLTSGGVASNINPSATTDLIFDDNSSNQQLVINLTGLIHVKSIQFKQLNNDYFLTGSNLSTLYCDGNFVLNSRSYFEANTKLVFSNAHPLPALIDFSRNTANSDVLFEKGNWDIKVLKVGDVNTITFLKGNYNINNCLLVAGNLIANTGNVVFNSNKSPFKIKNRLALGSNVSFNSNDFILIANSGNPQQYQVHKSVSFGQNARVVNPNPMACAVSTSFTNSPCGNTCSASFAVNFDPGCVNGPYNIIFSTSAPCIPTGTNGISPPALVYTNLCNSCAGYQVDGVVFDIDGNFETTFSGFTQQIVSPISINYIAIRSPSCFGVCNGSISFFLNSGKQPYTVTIDPTSIPPGPTFTNVPAIVTQTVSNLCAGVHTISVRDDNGCVQNFTQTIAVTPSITPNGISNSITCNGVCNGSATVSPTGGTAPYSFSWLSSSSTPSTASTSTIGNLCPGVVSMTVTDSRTCTATYTTNIIQPPPITLTVTKTDLNCGSICNGTASVTATGGIGAFTYSWSPTGGTAAAATGLCAGNYTCTVTNNVNCIKTITVEILSPPTLTASPTQSDILCNAVCNGSINLNPSGGTPNFTYSWSPAVSTGSVATNLCAGPYTYTITDFLGCRFTNTVTIVQPPATSLTIASTSVTCNGYCDGTAIGNMTGGTIPYTYSWSPGGSTLTGQGTPTITNLCPATYTLRVTDANNCIITRTVSITQPTPIAINVTSVSPTCNGVCNGSINSIPTGGTAPYSYTLQPSAGAPINSNPPFTNLCAGLYTLSVSDNSSCVRTQTINLVQPNPIILTLNSTPINCFNQCNATISAVVNGGTPLYTFTWSAGGNGSSISNQCVGVHTATVTDANGCRGTGSVSITSPPELNVTITPTHPNCNAQCTGIATTSVTGGTPNYTVNWNNGGVGNIVNNLCQGVYTATVTDFFGCIKTQTVAIVTPPAITLTATNGTVSCAGSCDGTVSVTATGGTSGYFYSWSPTAPVQTSPVASGLCVGNYVASVTDSKGCIASIAANVTQPPVLTASVSNVQSSCNVCIGSATAHGIGGTAPYTYSWQPGGQTTQTANNLCVGVQTVIVTDSKGCTSIQTVQINQTVIVLVTSNSNTLSCNNICSGVATANATGGLLPYSFTWTPAPIQNTQTATGLCAGSHTVMVSDANGCSSTDVVTFVNPPAITLTVNKTDITCNGSCNGTASASVLGGTGSLSYSWLPGGQTTSSISGLCQGSYTVTATDINNCSQSQVITITQSASLTASFTFTNPTTCSTANGAIGAVISGGTPGYTLTWSPGGSGVNPLVNLPAGTYSLNVTDAAGCTQTIVTTLSNPTGPTVTVTSNSITCFGACTGSASLSITGVSPFSVNWPAPVSSTNTAVSGLCVGLYIPVITDGNNCVTNQTVNIAQPLQIAGNGLVTNATCNAACTASINLTPSGGTPGYTYSWLPSGGNVEDPLNLCVGTYSVIISDANSCAVTNTFVVSQPTALALSFNKKNVLCHASCTGGVKAIVSGGTSPYTYTWTPSLPFAGANIDTLVNLCAGIYTVTASDANGCVITGTVDITESTAVTASITSVNVKCNGNCNGSAVINAAGGTAPYSYAYNTTPITLTQAISGLCVGTYTGIVSDANGCTVSNIFNITEPLPIVITTTVSNPKCNAVCNGSVATTVTGGNPGYNYSWITSGGPVANPTGLCAGNYTVVVTDDSLCTGQALVVLTDPIILIPNISPTNPTCNGVCNGILTANPIGGTAPFNYLWSAPTNTNQTVSNLCAGTYTLQLTDVNLCQNTQTVTLTAPAPIALNPAITPATCGFSNGSINAVASSGVPPYTYNWLPPVSSTNTIVTNLAAGIYTVVVTDASACSATVTIPLSNSNGPSGATITSTNVTCNSLCNGAAAISNPVAGTAPYTLSWINPVSTNSLITGLCTGNYTAQIADANSCLFFQSVNIAEPQSIDDNEIIISAACLGNCNGSISVNPSGGNGGYSYNWSNSATTQTVSGLCPGPISITITDNLNCTYATTYTIPSITTITSSTFATNNACFGNCNGTLLATNVAGGLPPYTFSWSDPLGQSSALATGLCNNNYSVTIKDANGCFNVLPAVITSPAQVTFTPTITEPSCDLCNGAAVINPTGGIPSYSYQWSNSQTGNSASNLCAGVYMVQVTDGNGCRSNANVIINSSSSITGETITSTNILCGATCNGTASVTAIGGTLPISYHWVHNGSSSQSLSGLCAGTYYCNMTDANGCTRTASVVINATADFTVIPNVTQSSCTANTGSITVNVSGGTGAYTYTWMPSGNTASITNLAPGNYTLTVSDGNCTQTQVYSINSVNGPLLTSTKKDITCNAVCDGSVGIAISAGTPGYTILWSNGLATPTIGGLCSGAYSVMVTDAAGCIAVRNFSINQNSPIVFSAPDIDNPLCNNNCNGSLTSIPSGGVLPYTYSWTPNSSSVPTSNNLCAGNYSVTVRDANGCAAVETYTLTGPSTISVTAVVSDARCNATSTGTIDLTVLGGTPSYTYNWTPGNIATQDLTNIVAGTYSVTITDANGCNIDTSFTINEPTLIDDNEVITSAACFGNCNGSIALNPTGGNGGYTYSWTPSASTGTITNLCPGPQTATITDLQGCTFIASYNVPSLVTITSTTLAVNNNCFNDCNGVLTATNVAGGTTPYTYQWNDPIGQVGPVANGLCTGNYLVTITDANGCFNQIPAGISAPAQVTFTPNITTPSCDQCNGSAVVNPVGGIPSYTYLWSNNETGNTATGLCGGVYAVQITDGNGCVNTTNVVVNSASGITSETIVSTDVSCSTACDGSINITAVGGVGVISYHWVHDNSSSQTLTGLCAGTYYCNMTDINGCSRTASVVIGSVTTLSISSQVTQSSCSSNTGSITVNVSGGTGTYTYVWLPAGSTPTLTNLAPGIYTLTVSDGNGCSRTEVYAINAVNAPVITSVKKDISCNAVCDGSIAVTITGGTPAYQVLWSNAAITPSIGGLCAGVYSVQVTDASGCVAVRNFSLNAVSPIIFSSPDLDDPKCHDDCNGSLTAIPVGGTMPYTFNWTPNNVTTATTNSLCTGVYSITITDINGCPASASYSLTNPPTLTLTAVVTDASCNTALDGAIDVTVAGGVTPYNYNWIPGSAVTQDLINVLSGSYTLTLTDNFGCVIDSVLQINSTLTVNAIAGNDTLFCQNGTLQLNGSNSNGGVSYQWTEIPSGSVVSNTLITTVTPATGTSTYVLTATNGACIDNDTIIVTSHAVPVVDAGPMISIPIYSSATIGGNPTGPGGSTFNWSPATALDNPTGANPTTGTTVTTIYTVTVVDANGCSNSDTVTVFIYPEIRIPNGFSPNGDGKNDVWQIDFISQFPNCEVEVYNRWGEQLFYSKGYAVPFNGQYKGKDLPVGTYYYIINLNHPAYPKAYTSPLTIFR